MSQLELLPAPTKLTSRQAEALTHLEAAGSAGLTASVLGQLLWPPAHSRTWEDRSKTWALSILKALKKKQLVRQKQHGVWQAVDAHPTINPEETPDEIVDGWDGIGTVPYGVIPY